MTLGSIAILLLGCGDDGGREEREPEVVRPAPEEGSPHEDEPAVRVVFVGTSLTEGYGLADPAKAYPERVAAIADSAGYSVDVVNAGLSGETSAGALARIDWVVSRPVDVLVLEVGANDGLRGIDPDELEANLREIVRRARDRQPGVQILLLAMEAPPNLGGEYTDRFRSVYHRIAGEPGVVGGPFILDDVAGVPELNQADGIHPTREGHERMARTVWSALEALIREAGAADRSPALSPSGPSSDE